MASWLVKDSKKKKIVVPCLKATGYGEPIQKISSAKDWRMELITKEEIEQRMSRFQRVLAEANLDGAFILQNMDMFYFAGTIQASVLFIPREGSPVLMVQKAWGGTC